MPFTTLTKEAIEALYRSQVRGLIPNADLTEGSDEDLRAQVMGTVFLGNQEQARYLARQIFPRTADAEYLEQHKATRGLPDINAAKASGTVILIGSSAGLVQAAGSLLTAPDGEAYTLDANATTVQATFTGKTWTVEGTNQLRIRVAPDVSSMFAGDVVQLAPNVYAVIRDVISDVNIIEFEAEVQYVLAGGAISAPYAAVASVTASATGPSGNKDSYEILTVDSPTAGIDANAYVSRISGGGDDETTAELRSRLEDFIAARPGSGNLEDFRQWARETPNVRIEDAFVYSGLRAGGTVDIMPRGTLPGRVTGDNVNAAIQAYVDSKAGANDDAWVRPMEYDATYRNVEMTVAVAAGYEPDNPNMFTLVGNAVGVDGPALIAGGSSTTELEISVLYSPASVGMKVNHRIAIHVTIGGGQETFVRRISSVQGTSITLDAALPVAPAVGDEVWPASATTESIIDAVYAKFDALGPGATNLVRWPDPTFLYPFELYKSDLVVAARSVSGIRDADVTVPVSTATVPPDGKVLRPGYVKITHA